MELPLETQYRTAMVLGDAEAAERVQSFPSLPVDHRERFDEAGELVGAAKLAKK